MRINNCTLKHTIVLVAVAFGGCIVNSEPSEPGLTGTSQALSLAGKATTAENVRELLAQEEPAGSVWHSFTSAAGDEVDCVDFYEQASVRRLPAAQQQELMRLSPGQIPMPLPPKETGPSNAAQGRRAPADVGADAQGRERRCPPGSVPTLHQSEADLKRFATFGDYHRKFPNGMHSDDDEYLPADSATHEHARFSSELDNWGAQSVLNLWKPTTAADSEFSLSQIWVVRGSGSDKQTVEVGWQKYKQKYGDTKSHLFIYYTPDNYDTGCYNKDKGCSVFVQLTGTQTTLGGTWSVFSSLGGSQYDVTVRFQFCPVSQCGASAGWWLYYSDANISEYVGYYPQSLFDSAGLQDQARFIRFGGEVAWAGGTPHTTTDMGSSVKPSGTCSSCFGQVAYQKNIQNITTGNVWATPALETRLVTSASCYEALNYSGGSWGRYVYYGGTGFSGSCP